MTLYVHAYMQVIMVTGDHPITAKAIARMVGIISPGILGGILQTSNILNMRSVSNFSNGCCYGYVTPLACQLW